MAAAKGVLRYIHGTATWGLRYGSVPNLELVGYADADFAGDSESRRSTSGFVVLMAGAAISWSSKRQSVITISTTEAEYVAASTAVREVLWLGKLRLDMGLDLSPALLFGDNESTLKVLQNPIASQRTKHIDIAYKFARERVSNGDVRFEHVRSQDMVADCLTKSLPKDAHMRCCMGMGLVSA
jgi:hypothetical protein